MTINILSELFYINEDIDYQAIKEAGFVGIELRVGNIIENEDLQVIDSVKNNLKKNNLKIFSIHAPFKGVDISSNDEYIRKRSIREIEKSIMIANKLSVKNIVIHLSSVFENNRDKHFLNIKKSLEEIKTLQNMFGIELIIENLLPNMFMYNFEETKKIIEMGYSICFDTGHALISGLDIIKYYKTFDKYIKIIHLNINNKKNDEHCFIDKYDYKEIKNLIKLFSDNRIIVFEVLKRDYTEKQLIKIYEEKLNDNN